MRISPSSCLRLIKPFSFRVLKIPLSLFQQNLCDKHLGYCVATCIIVKDGSSERWNSLVCIQTQKVLMQDSAVKEELQLSKEDKDQLIELQNSEEQKSVSLAAISQADSSKDKEPDMLHKAKSSSAVKPNSSKKTRKRGRRKIGSSKKNRKATG